MQRRTAAEYLDYDGTAIGQKAVIRSHSVFYRNVVIEHHVRTGHRVTVREGRWIGDHALIGSNVVVDNNCRIGSHVSIQSNVYMALPEIVWVLGRTWVVPKGVPSFVRRGWGGRNLAGLHEPSTSREAQPLDASTPPCLPLQRGGN